MVNHRSFLIISVITALFLISLVNSPCWTISANERSHHEKLIYYVKNQPNSSYQPSTTKLYEFSPADQSGQLLFTDENTPIVIDCNAGISSFHSFSCSCNKVYAQATDRYNYLPGRQNCIVELSLDGSNSFHSIFKPNKNSPFDDFFVNHSNTKFAYFYWDNAIYKLNICELDTGQVLHTINITKMFLDCIVTNARWLVDDTLVLTIDTGDDHVTSEEAYSKVGIYSMREDGTDLHLLGGNFKNLIGLPDFLGQLPDQTRVYHGYELATPNDLSYLYYENPSTHKYRKVLTKNGDCAISASGNYLVFVEVNPVDDQYRVKLKCRNLINNRDILIRDFGRISYKTGVNIVGWLEN